MAAQEDWDASDDEDAEKKDAKPAGPAPPVRAKGITKQKIAEREAADKARAAEIAARVSAHLFGRAHEHRRADLARAFVRQRDDDPQARKAREKAAMLKADLANAADLFGGLNTGGPSSSCPARPAPMLIPCTRRARSPCHALPVAGRL